MVCAIRFRFTGSVTNARGHGRELREPMRRAGRFLAAHKLAAGAAGAIAVTDYGFSLLTRAVM